VASLAARFASARVVGLEVPLIALWAALATVLSLVTERIRDWNAMSDELHYERLAISIVQTHSLLPRLHGEVTRSLAQLYPALISPWFARGYVPADLQNAHIFNAWMMTSACIPSFLLARRVTGRRWAAYLLAFLTVCTPWMLYATTLQTEVAAYPVFLWAFLAMNATLTSPSVRRDVLALLALVLAFLARTQFVVLALALPVAIALFDRRSAIRRHRVLAVVYGAGLLVVLVAVAVGWNIFSVTDYGSQASGHLLPRSTAGAMLGNVADLAFLIGILPFLVGGAWLLANGLRDPFACLGATTVVVVVVEIAKWDLHVGDFVIDRYLFYLAPLLLIAFVRALLDPRRPRWSLFVPAALVVGGFAGHLQPDFLWAGHFPVSIDSPGAWLYRPFADLAGSNNGASALLAAVTLGLAAGFVVADRLVRPALLTTVLCAALLVAFPPYTVTTFAKLLDRNGHSGRPLTQSQAGVLDWLDRTVGTNGRVTEVPFAVSTAFLVTQKFWRDLEFWNKSVRYAAHDPTGAYGDAVIWFPANTLTVDPKDGRASRTFTPYVVQSVGETRFRISGTVVLQRPDVMLIRADMPWRADWASSGLYDDGWTKPRTPAHIRVFATPRQRGAVTRTLTLQLRAPEDVESRPFRIAWAGGSTAGAAGGASSVSTPVQICVPAHGHAEVEVSTPGVSAIPGDQRNLDASLQPRRGGLLLAGISLADEIGPPCNPK
jgi:hypothetical protein